MDGDERRRRALVAGREMLAKYKSDRSYRGSNSTQSGNPSDADSSRNGAEAQSAEPQGACANEGLSSRDVTHSSVSMSEGEGDGDLEGMAGRVAELEELLQGKEAVVEALHAEIDNLRGEASSPNSSQSRASSIQYRDIIITYHNKLQEFEQAVNQRDSLIEDLTASLEQALSSRDALVAQLNALNSMQIVNPIQPMENNTALQEKISTLENNLGEQKTLINELHAQLTMSREQTQKLEMERETQKAEISDYKLQIEYLNGQIRAGAAENNLNISERLEQQKQYETRVDTIKRDMQMILEKFTTETNANTAKHQKEFKDLEAKHKEELIKMRENYEEQVKSMREENKILSDRLNRELPHLESKHAKELSVFQAQLSNYKKTVEALKLELVNHSEAQKTSQAEVSVYKSQIEELGVQGENKRRQQELNNQKEKAMLHEQIKLHKIQLEEITSKYVAASSVLDSKESLERSLEQALLNAATLRQENDSLKFKLDDLSIRYSAAQSLIENSQAQERSMSTKIYELEKSMSRLSGVSVSTLSELNETSYQTFDEAAIQYHITRRNLEEKLAMEKQLIERVNELQSDVRRANEELERVNLVKESYEKQLKDMKNSCDKWKLEASSMKEPSSAAVVQPFQGSLYFGADEGNEKKSEGSQKPTDFSEIIISKDQEILDLRVQLQSKEEEVRSLTENVKQADDEREHMKEGHSTVWEQCDSSEKLPESSAVKLLKDQVELCEQEIKDLRAILNGKEHDECVKQIFILTEKLKKSDGELKELKERLSEENDQYKSEQVTMSSSEVILSKDQEIKDLGEHLPSVEEERLSLAGKSKKSDGELEHLREDKSDSSQELPHSSELMLLKDQIEMYEQENKNLREQMISKEEHNECVRQIFTLTEKLKKSDEEREQMKKRLIAAREQLKDSQEPMLSSGTILWKDQEINELRELLKSKEDHNECIKQIYNLTEMLRRSNDVCEGMKKSLCEKMKMIHLTDQMIEDLKVQLLSKEEKIVTLTEKSKISDYEFEHLRKVQGDSSQKLPNLSEVIILKDKIGLYEQEIKDLREQLKNKDEHNECARQILTLTEKLDQSVNECNQLKKKLTAATEQFEGSSEIILSKDKEIMDLRAQLESKEEYNEYTRKISQLTEKLEKSDYEREQLEEGLSAVKKEYRSIQKLADSLNEQIDLYKQEIKDLREQLNSEEKRVEYMTQIHTLTEKLKKSDNECEELKKGLAAVKEQYEILKTMTDSSKETSSTDQVKLYEQENKSLREQLDNKNVHNECVKQIESLTDKLKKSNEEREQLKKGLTTAWKQCAEFEEKLNLTLATNDSVFEDSLAVSAQSSKIYDLSRDNLANVDDSSTFIREPSDRSIDLEKKLELMKEENRILVENQSAHSEIVARIDVLQTHVEELECEKLKILEENENLLRKQEDLISLKLRIEQLVRERDSLIKERQNMVDKHADEVNVLKLDSAGEVQKLRSLLFSLKEGSAGLSELKDELEERHAKEMEELRTYFEQKCLQMEKQYSEEVFSQQSKKMSDNDSEIEELTEDLYFGGGGDCVNVSEHSSRAGTPVVNIAEHQSRRYASEGMKPKIDSDEKLEALQRELQQKTVEIESLKSEFDKKLADQQKLHEEEMKVIRGKTGQVALLTAVNQPCQTEWDPVALESGELTELRAAYSHQLEEQVALARLDIVNALQEQIQALLSADDSDAEQSWPTELLELRNKFTNGSKREIESLKERHGLELMRLKEEHSRNLARTIERHQEEMNKIKLELLNAIPGRRQMEDGNSSQENDLIRERDNLHKMCLTLKSLVSELINYFAMCEEEVNNTLISEVLKTQLSKSEKISDAQKKQQESDSEQSETIDPVDPEVSSKPPRTTIKRVHFAPNSSRIVSIINNGDDTLQDLVEEEEDVTQKLKAELDLCLDRLKSESSQILGVSLAPGESKLDTLAKQVLWSNKLNEELSVKLTETENLLIGYQEESEQLKVKILELQQRLTSAENKKEVVTEGYGEHEESGAEVTIQNLSQLQDKARSVLMNGGGENSYLLQLIEDLCRHGDKVADDSKREREDLQLQIEAADKQLRATRKFLEEQAGEREAERDEAARQIQLLREQIKDKEREKERDQRITSEPSLLPLPPPVSPVLGPTDIIANVEALESQMREMSSMMSESEAKKSETESELKAAVDKIWVLRDIITDLEQQVQAKTEREETLQSQIDQLEELIAAQTKNQQELAQELDAMKMGGENSQLNEHISHLQEELRKHKLSSEHFNVNSTALNQMKVELREMESQLDKRTKELESLHMVGSSLSLSQPSEDVSIRDQIDASRCLTPDDPHSPPTLPLDQLLKLKEKMAKHARAEEVALKRIKDLDMQLTALKNQNEELQAEQEILHETASEQLFQIEAMRGRLEQQKQSAPFAQKQATSRLELQLHEVNAKLHSLEREAADKELQVKDLKSKLDRANKLLMEKDGEIEIVVQTENKAVQKLRDRLEILEEEKKLLESKVGIQERTQQELPQLIDSMLADKNDEIDHLKEQLSKRDKQLELYLSLNLDENQLKDFLKQAEPKNSARTLSDILSINSECEEPPEALRDATNFTQTLPHNLTAFKTPSITPQSKDPIQISPMVGLESGKTGVQVPRLELGSQSRSASGSSPAHSQASLGVELAHGVSDLKSPSSGDSSVCNVDDTRSQSSAEQVEAERVSMEVQTGGVSKHGETTFQSTDDGANVAQCPRHGAKSTVKDGKQARDSARELNQQRIKTLESQLGEIKRELETKSTDLRKRESEVSDLQRDVLQLRKELKERMETLTQEKAFYKSQLELTQGSEAKIKKDMLQVENILKLTTEELREYRSKMQTNEKIIMELNEENAKLKRGMDEKENRQLLELEASLREKSQELKNLKEIIFEKDITIESIETRNVEIENENKQLYEYKTKFESLRREFSESQEELQRLAEGLNNRDMVIRRLEEMARRSSLSGASSPGDNKDQEIHHLQEHLKEKDKVIRQMSDDSKSLHRALETIQNKMKESGNVLELRKKLKEERRMNAELKETVEKLSNELEKIKQDSTQQSEEDGDIEDMVQRELNLSARLDRQIMDAIESEPEEGVVRRIERHSCNSLDIQPVDQGRQDRVAQRYNDTRLKLKQVQRMNDELNKLKDDLEIEREMLKSQVGEYESRILQIKSDLEDESKKVWRLDEELSRERDLVRNLRVQIKRDQSAAYNAQMHDSELISDLRMKLEASLDAEEKLRRDLSVVRREHKSLEAQLSAIKEQMESQKTETTPSLQQLLETEQKKYVMLAEEFEKEQRKNGELRDTARSIEAEKNKYEKQLEVVIEDREKLASCLALAEGLTEHLQTDLKRTKEELKGREDECEWLQKRIKTMSDAENKRKQQRTNEHNELKSLRREVANSREVMLDLEADMAQSKKELAKSLETQKQLAQCIQASTEKEADLNKKLSAFRDEEKRLKDVIADMQNDLQISVRRELELTDELRRERLSSEKNVPAKFVQKIKELNESLDRYSREKNILHDKLTHAREEKEQFAARVRLLESQMSHRHQTTNNTGAVSSEMAEKIQHFYGKYLRVDSRRKALAYQKRYLLCVVGGYQISEQSTLSVLAQLTQTQRLFTMTSGSRRSPRVCFRSAVFAVMSIHRMKWLIVRWRTGRRVGANAVLGNPDQSFMPLRRSTSNHSPPVRDRAPSNGDGQGAYALEHYLERIMNIQQTLGLAMADPEANRLISD